MKELTFQDVAYDDCDAMHASKELSTAIAILECAKPSSVLPEDVVVERERSRQLVG